MKKKIKVIRIDNDKFYLDMLEGGIKTTNHINKAKDVTGLSFSVISWIMKGLSDKGHKPEIIEYLKK
ncbi:hypothetical protein PQE68_gp229 [Bacillus phage vB_BanS_Sophrita]|uniref:Uncharacterized protein n=2 Tax=Sophritavirus TaxID=3044834 RepID=A0AAE8YVS3_9CAUD|nr:hypothetical protein PQE68_gp229 [Bacillus phage vB_BanS_Sophrita]UGO50853.1 hypothetical protein SOPHRITA_266 [Bacillus phage vB_BanS_Sophrita]